MIYCCLWSWISSVQNITMIITLVTDTIRALWMYARCMWVDVPVCTLYVHGMYGWISSPTSTKRGVQSPVSNLQNRISWEIQGVLHDDGKWRRDQTEQTSPRQGGVYDPWFPPSCWVCLSIPKPARPSESLQGIKHIKHSIVQRMKGGIPWQITRHPDCGWNPFSFLICESGWSIRRTRPRILRIWTVENRVDTLMELK